MEKYFPPPFQQLPVSFLNYFTSYHRALSIEVLLSYAAGMIVGFLRSEIGNLLMKLQRHREADLALPNSLFISRYITIRAGLVDREGLCYCNICHTHAEENAICSRLIKILLNKLMVLFYNSDSQEPVWFLPIGTIIRFMSLAISHENLDF